MNTSPGAGGRAGQGLAVGRGTKEVWRWMGAQSLQKGYTGPPLAGGRGHRALSVCTGNVGAGVTISSLLMAGWEGEKASRLCSGTHRGDKRCEYLCTGLSPPPTQTRTLVVSQSQAGDPGRVFPLSLSQRPAEACLYPGGAGMLSKERFICEKKQA